MSAGEKVDILKMVKSPVTPVYWVKVIMYLLGAIAIVFGWVYPVYHTYIQKQKTVPTTTIGSAGTVVQDCSCQVRDAILEWEKLNKKSEPWIKLRLWKIISVGLGGT